MRRDGALRTTQPLRVGVPQEARVARTFSSLVGIGQDPSKRMGTAGGVGALDPSTREMTGFLRLPRSQLMWASVQDQAGERWLLLHIPYGEGGGIVAWDPVRQQLRAVTRIDAQAAHVSLAGSALL